MQNSFSPIAEPESVIQPAGFYTCANTDALTAGDDSHLSSIKDQIDRAITVAGLTLFGSQSVRYSNEAAHGYTYLAWIGESAIDIHTWPEFGSAIVNAHTCNISHDNSAKVARFFEILESLFGTEASLASPVRLSLTTPVVASVVEPKPSIFQTFASFFQKRSVDAV